MKRLFSILLVCVAMVVLTEGQSPNMSVSDWIDEDIGVGAVGGRAQSDGSGIYTLSSAGADIYGTNDVFNYLYQPLGTNGQLVARLLGISAANGYAKAGVMIRESLEAGIAEATMTLMAGNGLRFLWRGDFGGETERSLANTNYRSAPYWLKVVRYGDWVGGYASPEGISWTLMGWTTMKGLPEEVYVGLAVSAHGGAGAQGSVQAQFDQVSLGAANMSDVLFPVSGSGDGLRGSYHDNRHLFGVAVTNRVDRQVDFNFSAVTHEGETYVNASTNLSLKILGIARNREFGVRWMGELQAQFTEPYTLYVSSSDGVRVWLDEQLIMDDWRSQFPQEAKETPAVVNLVAGRKYLLRVEYFKNNHGSALAEPGLSSPSTPKRVIPQSQLYSQPTDTEGNGLPDLWEEHYFGHAGVDPNADPDGDGLSNLQEYQRYSDPTNPLNRNVPNEWGHGDIDDWGENQGDASYSNGVFTVTSLGDDFANKKLDSFHYVYRTLGTNGELVARVRGTSATNILAKAGLMIRETLQGRSRETTTLLTYWLRQRGQATMTMTASNGLQFVWRGDFGGRPDETLASPDHRSTPYWLKVMRYGDWLGGYGSPDGTNWTLAGWTTMKGLPEQVYVGLVVSAHNGGSGAQGQAQAQFDQVTLKPADVSEVVHPLLGKGDGLRGDYRNDSLLYLPGITNRVDWQVDFQWLHDHPVSILNPDSYGVCWSGEMQSQFTEPYTFSLETRREDWARVWIDEQLVIDGWRSWHPNGDLAGSTLNLVAGERHLIRVEMFNNLGMGEAILKWSSPSTPKQPVPQSQLYSQPVMDPDRSGLPVRWEMIYFGHTGVDPNADPDGDGLSNLQEYQYHTHPLKADTEGDGMPDAWEVAHGLDPQFNDANLDYNNSGFNNLQEYQHGLDPFNSDMNADGLPDGFEEEYLGAGSTLSVTNSVSVAALANGAQATNYLGNWQVDGNDIYALDRRGGLDFNLSVANADKYVFNLTGTQNQPNPFETRLKLLLGIDGQTLGHYFLNVGYGTNGEVALVLPYLKAGSHTVHVFWDGVASYSSLRIKQVKLLSVSGSDADHNGIKDWADKMISDESGLDNTNTVVGSYISPVCLEGRDLYPAMTVMTNNLATALWPVATTDGRWYVNAPLQANTQTVFQTRYQNGAFNQTRQLQWMPVNLLTTTNSLAIRKGDSLLFTALPSSGVNGNLQITIGTNTYTGKAAKGISNKFTTPGTYTVSGTYTPTSGSPKNGSITVDVVPQQNLPNIEPAAWTGMQRNLNLPNLAPEAVLQADSRMTCFIAGTNANGAVQLTLGADANEARTILARLGTNGPVLDSTRAQGFDLWTGNQAYTKILQVYPDGSQLVEELLVSSPVLPDVTFVLQPTASGIIFDDGTTIKTLTATNFDALGQCPVHFIRPASAITSICHFYKAYQANYQIGYRR